MTCIASGGCERPRFARGLCKSHYVTRPGERLPSARSNAPRQCANGCRVEALARGLCRRCYVNRPEQKRQSSAHARAYRSRNPQRAAEQIAELETRTAADPGWARAVKYASNARRRAREYGARVEPRIDFRGIIAEFGMICHLCGGSIATGDLHFDHVTPLARGGAHSRDNLKPSHAGCNIRKGASVIPSPHRL